MNHYRIVKGTKIMRWDFNQWEDFVTTKEVYYTDEDNVTPSWAQNVTRFRIPDEKYSMISVPNDKVIHICPGER